MNMVDPVLTVGNESDITFHVGTGELMRIEKNGFYVRGIRVPQDEKEAEKVYNAFHQWLTWATLNRTY